jgi:hypothetical protein
MPSYMQIENVEVAQSKTASEIKELRNHHNQSRKRLEKLENDVEEASLTLTGSAKTIHSNTLTSLHSGNENALQCRIKTS